VWDVVKDKPKFSGVSQVYHHQAPKRTKTSSTGEYSVSASNANFGYTPDSDDNFGVSLDDDDDDIIVVAAIDGSRAL